MDENDCGSHRPVLSFGDALHSLGRTHARKIDEPGRAARLFRRECVLHTPLFAGFPGFRSKLWIDDTETGV
jgi:hypothetical protein